MSRIESSLRHAVPMPAAMPLPAAPRTVAETGLSLQFLMEFVAKALLMRDPSRLLDLASRLRLPANVVEEVLEFMRGQRLVELARRGATHGDVIYALSEAGRARAGEFLRKCHYVGAVPVSLASYVEQTQRQGLANLRITREDVEQAFAELILSEELRDQIGAAMNSGRSIFLYGPAGSGKTYLAEQLVTLLGGAIAVPHAFAVDDEVVQVFDPLVHHPVPMGGTENALDARHNHDRRWELCRRPFAVAGGELRPEILDLQFDSNSGYYQAPPQVKANNGLFLIDDLGRQLITPEQLMNRWIVPMDRHHDQLALHTGASFTVPFDVLLVFSTNLAPADVADDAFLRRLGYKIHVGPVNEGLYRDIFRQACVTCGLPYSDAGFADLLALHRRHRSPTLACYPRDLLGLIRDQAVYRGCAARIDSETLDRAWHSYFCTNPGEPS